MNADDIFKSAKSLEYSERLYEDVLDRRQDRRLKGTHAKSFLWILGIQLAVMNLVFIMVGFYIMHFDKWTLELYMGGTLAEVFGLVAITTKHLFPRRS